MEKQVKDCGVLITAAGNATRYGAPKVFQPFSGKKTMLAYICQCFYHAGFDSIYITFRKEHKELVENFTAELTFPIHPVYIDKTDFERFYSLQTGIKTMSAFSYIFIHNGDMPFIFTPVLNQIYLQKDKSDCIKPVYERKSGHPVLVNRTVMNQIIQAQPESTLHEVLASVNSYYIEVPVPWYNQDINTPDEMELYKEIIPYEKYIPGN